MKIISKLYADNFSLLIHANRFSYKCISLSYIFYSWYPKSIPWRLPPATCSHFCVLFRIASWLDFVFEFLRNTPSLCLCTYWVTREHSIHRELWMYVNIALFHILINLFHLQFCPSSSSPPPTFRNGYLQVIFRCFSQYHFNTFVISNLCPQHIILMLILLPIIVSFVKIFPSIPTSIFL